MAMEFPDIKKYAGLFSKGFIIQIAPKVAEGYLVELLKAKGISVKVASEWVENNSSLWKALESNEQETLRNLAERAGNIDWLDLDWTINAIKGDLPAIASLFLGWKKANNWLKRQIEQIRKEIGQ